MTRRPCPTCGVAVLGSKRKPINASYDPRGLTHAVTCIANQTKDTTVTEPAAQPSIWDEMDDPGGDFYRIPDGEKYAGTPLIIPEGVDGTDWDLARHMVDANRYKRCTSYIEAVEDDYGIAQWKRHLTVDGTLGWDAATRDEWSFADWQTKVQLCNTAFNAAGGWEKANRGTRMHTLTDIVDKGEPLGLDGEPAGISDSERADLHAYAGAVASLTLIHAEVKTVHDRLGVAGTPDRVWDLSRTAHRDWPGTQVWRKPRVGDLKTGKLDARKVAMQMALYARSRLYNVVTGERTDLDVDLDVAIVVHLPYGEAKARILEVDITAGWEGVLLCAEVYKWRKRNGMATTWGPPVVERRDDLLHMIDAAPTSDALKALWATNRAVWTDAHTAAAKARTAAMTAEVAA